MAGYGLPPKELMLTLQEAFSLERFLETGTYRGRTAAWAAGNFDEVVTIEASSDLHDAARRSHGHLGNVRWVHGDTRDVLASEVARLAGPAVVWLDSHWSGGSTYGEGTSVRFSPRSRPCALPAIRITSSSTMPGSSSRLLPHRTTLISGRRWSRSSPR